MTENHHFLVLIRLDFDAAHPTRPLRHEGGRDDLPYMDENKTYFYLAGVLQPSDRSTSAPLSVIQFDARDAKHRAKLRSYNNTLKRLGEINDLYFGDSGFVAQPHTYNQAAKKNIVEKINAIGQSIYGILKGTEDNRALGLWLDRMLGADIERGNDNVTIITNDFSIPWYWVKSEIDGPFLCQIYPVGMLQLTSMASTAESDLFWRRKIVEDGELYKVLVINGASDLPLSADEVANVRAALEGDLGRVRKFEVDQASTNIDLMRIREKYHNEQGRLIEQFKIVHFTGHYEEKSLRIGDQPIIDSLIDKIIDGSVLVLDGCSSSRGLKGWRDLDTVTDHLMYLGALGCVVTVLPVKQDPIITRVVWGEFYRQLRLGASLGQALSEARLQLKEHFDSLGAHDPTWLLYQLVGNPSVALLDHDAGGPAHHV
jgi:hypothetical protein